MSIAIAVELNLKPWDSTRSVIRRRRSMRTELRLDSMCGLWQRSNRTRLALSDRMRLNRRCCKESNKQKPRIQACSFLCCSTPTMANIRDLATQTTSTPPAPCDASFTVSSLLTARRPRLFRPSWLPAQTTLPSSLPRSRRAHVSSAHASFQLARGRPWLAGRFRRCSARWSR